LAVSPPIVQTVEIIFSFALEGEASKMTVSPTDTQVFAENSATGPETTRTKAVDWLMLLHLPVLATPSVPTTVRATL
jgi:hypothetical protein